MKPHRVRDLGQDPGADPASGDPGADPGADDEAAQGPYQVPTELDAYGRPKKGSRVICESAEAASQWDARDWNRVS